MYFGSHFCDYKPEMPYILDSWCDMGSEDEAVDFRVGQIVECYLYEEREGKMVKQCNGLFVINRVKDYPFCSATCLGTNLDTYTDYYVHTGQDGCVSSAYQLHFCSGSVDDCEEEEVEDDDEYVHIDTYRVCSNALVKTLLTNWKVALPEPRIFKQASKINYEMKQKQEKEPSAATKTASEAAKKKPRGRPPKQTSSASVDTKASERPKKKKVKRGAAVTDSPSQSSRGPGSREASALDAELEQLRVRVGRLQKGAVGDEKLLKLALDKSRSGRPDLPRPDDEDEASGAAAEDEAALQLALLDDNKGKRKAHDGDQSASKRLKAALTLAERAKTHAGNKKSSTAASAATEGEGSTGNALTKFLTRFIKSRHDEDSDEMELDTGLDSKRMVYRKLAKSKPGALLLRCINSMREQVTSVTGDEDEDGLSPICLRFFLSVFLPNHRDIPEHTLREIRTLCEALDGILKGKMMETADLLAMRLKASMLAVTEGWHIAKHLELLPATSKHVPIPQEEEEFMRKIESGEIKAREILARLRKAEKGEKDETQF